MCIERQNLNLVLFNVPYLVEKSRKENEDDNQANYHDCQQVLSL